MEPKILRVGKEFHQRVQFDWKNTAEGEIHCEHGIAFGVDIKRAAHVRRAKVQHSQTADTHIPRDPNASPSMKCSPENREAFAIAQRPPLNLGDMETIQSDQRTFKYFRRCVGGDCPGHKLQRINSRI